jgi:hypothetical protein
MLLHLTGVEIAAIQENYAEAFRVASRHVARMAEIHPEQTHERPYSIDEIEVRITERTEVLSDWLAGFDVGTWLADSGLSEREIEAVQRRLIP